MSDRERSHVDEWATLLGDDLADEPVEEGSSTPSLRVRDDDERSFTEDGAS